MAKKKTSRLDELKDYAWELACAGKTLPYIAKKVGRSERTVSRWIAHAEQTKPNALVKDEKTLKLKDELVRMSWKGLIDLVKSKKTPAVVKKDIYFRALNSEGHFIEQKKVDHSGQVDFTEVRKTKLQEGLQSFGLLADNSA